MAERYRGRAFFVGVSNHDTVADGKAYAAEFGVPYPLAHAPKVWRLYEVPYQPVTVVIGPDGRVASRTEGPITVEGLNETIQSFVQS